MKKWVIWLFLIFIITIASVYALFKVINPLSMKAYKEVSFNVPNIEAPSLHANIAGVGPSTFGNDQVVLVSFFATWCRPCHANHEMLKILKQKENIKIVGINLRDQSILTQFWLMEDGNPFSSIGSDPQGKVAALWGVQGIPQMFLVDKQKKVRYSYTGPLTSKSIHEALLPAIQRLNAEEA